MARTSIIAMTGVIAALTAAAPALAAHHRWTSPRLLHRWTVLNERCAGGAGNDQAACNERALVEDALFARGYCYVGEGAKTRWRRGLALRLAERKEQAVCHR
jgi:hypothetical protein